MKIAILIYSLGGGGAERATLTMAAWWTEAGHDVTIVLHGGNAKTAYPVPADVAVASLDGPQGQGLLASLGRVWRIRAALDRIKPDIVVSMMSTANVLLALASLGRPWRTIGAERVSPASHPQSLIWRWLRARTYRMLDMVVAQTTDAGDWLEHHTNVRAVAVIPNAIIWPLPVADTEGVGPPADRRRILLAVGRLAPQKGFVDLVRAFAGPARAHPAWDLHIVGEGEERAAIEDEAARLGMAGRVKLPGRTGDIGAWYRAADLFALSSLFEGFPNALLEAMASGLAVVSRDCPEGPADIIRPEVDGVLVPAQDVEAFSDTLDRLMGDEALRRTLGARAAEVRERFSESAVRAQWDAVLLPPVT